MPSVWCPVRLEPRLTHSLLKSFLSVVPVHFQKLKLRGRHFPNFFVLFSSHIGEVPPRQLPIPPRWLEASAPGSRPQCAAAARQATGEGPLGPSSSPQAGAGSGPVDERASQALRLSSGHLQGALPLWTSSQNDDSPWGRGRRGWPCHPSPPTGPE